MITKHFSAILSLVALALCFFFMQKILWAQRSSLRPQDPSYNPPNFLDKKKFQDLHPGGPILGFEKSDALSSQSLEALKEKVGILESSSFKRRYIERRWQHLDEEKEDVVLLEQAILDQFGRQGFSNKLAYHPYHESPSRRFQIIFLLSLPISLAYSYACVTFVKILLKSSNRSTFTDTDMGLTLALGLAFSGGIGYYDYQRSQEYNRTHKNEGNKFELWKQKW